MRCQSLRDAIVELARGREAGPGTAAAIESHLGHCRACATLMARERQLTAGLRALAASSAADTTPAVVGRNLLAAFAARQATQPRLVARTVPRWLSSAAAIAVTSAAAAWWWSGAGAPAQPGREGAPASVGEVAVARPSADPMSTPANGGADVAPVAGRRADRPRGRRAASTPPVVRAAGFVALPGATGLPDFESGEIIRLEIPLTSLPTYGLEIQPDAQGSRVEADLLVGQDGQARAIRLVTAGAGS